MKWDKIFFALALALAFVVGMLLSNAASAGTATLTWTAPTQNTDGTPLTDLAGYKIYYGTSATALTTVGTISSPTATTTVIPSLGVGTWYFAMTAFNAAGAESARTATVSKVITAPPPKVPNPPGGLTVTVTTAFTVVKQRDRFVMLPVGTVPPDTVCDTSQSVNGYYVVPRSAVTWSGSVKPEVVVASCS